MKGRSLNFSWFISKWSHFFPVSWTQLVSLLYTSLPAALFTPFKLVLLQTCAMSVNNDGSLSVFCILLPIYKIRIKTQPWLPIMCLISHGMYGYLSNNDSCKIHKTSNYGNEFIILQKQCSMKEIRRLKSVIQVSQKQFMFIEHVKVTPVF